MIDSTIYKYPIGTIANGYCNISAQPYGTLTEFRLWFTLDGKTARIDNTNSTMIVVGYFEVRKIKEDIRYLYKIIELSTMSLLCIRKDIFEKESPSDFFKIHEYILP